ncbi:unnamed protein product [Leptosia nina]|uniref:Uncharacterized protein n=1 Tax=Leptosia nina TaxID=320188 RepID=A0AAV1JQ41_9NEOP
MSHGSRKSGYGGESWWRRCLDPPRYTRTGYCAFQMTSLASNSSLQEIVLGIIEIPNNSPHPEFKPRDLEWDALTQDRQEVHCL